QISTPVDRSGPGLGRGYGLSVVEEASPVGATKVAQPPELGTAGPGAGWEPRPRMISTVTPTSSAAPVLSTVRTGSFRREPRARHARSPSERPRCRVGRR